MHNYTYSDYMAGCTLLDMQKSSELRSLLRYLQDRDKTRFRVIGLFWAGPFIPGYLVKSSRGDPKFSQFLFPPPPTPFLISQRVNDLVRIIIPSTQGLTHNWYTGVNS